MKARVAMADSSLKDLWTAAKDGNLSPLEQSRAWALREVYREMGIPEKKVVHQDRRETDEGRW